MLLYEFIMFINLYCILVIIEIVYLVIICILIMFDESYIVSVFKMWENCDNMCEGVVLFGFVIRDDCWIVDFGVLEIVVRIFDLWVLVL